jgi:DNA repair exonuclease SbcCD nuclease subunit
MRLDDFTLLGDVHLGRRFRVGVPLHRVGERERMVWADFESSIVNVGTPFHVCMGDIFDRFIVPPEVVLRAAEIYRRAPRTTEFFVLRGNHDVSRDTTRASSFDLFRHLVPHVHVIDTLRVRDNLAFVPFCPFTPVEEQIRQLPDGLELVFMHHDFVDFGGDQVIPTKLLAEKGITRVVNGHDHVARTETRHGVEVIMTGSMQPYSHAEDPDERFYVTTTLDRLGDVTNKHVRLALREGEDPPADLDCLSLTIQRVQNVEEIEPMNIETLDVGLALEQALEGLSIKDTLMGAFHDHSTVS